MKHLLTSCILIFILFFSCDVYAQKKSVLIIQSYNNALAWTRQCNQGIIGELGDKYHLEFEYLDTKRIPRSAFKARADVALEHFKQLRPDVVMLGDDNALWLLGPTIAKTGTPVVYFGINNNPRSYFHKLPENVTGVIERIPLFPWIRLLLDVVQPAHKVLVLMDGSPTADAIINVTFKRHKTVFFDGCDVAYSSTADWMAWQQIVKEADVYDFIVTPVFHALKDEAGETVSYEEVITWTSANSPVPVFAAQDYAVSDNGVVGACVVQGEEHGRIAGHIASEILQGRSPMELPSPDDQQGMLFFNEKQLKRFDLTLPLSIREKVTFR